MRTLQWPFALALAWLAVPAGAVADNASCSELAKLALPKATITMAAPVQPERSP